MAGVAAGSSGAMTAAGRRRRETANTKPWRALAVAAVVAVGALSGARRAGACSIQGYDSGTCAAPQDVQDRMPFCATVVRYPACVPTEVPWHGNLTLEAKDAWLHTSFDAFVSERRAIETGSYEPTDPTKYNYDSGGSVKSRFSDDDCVNAYRNFMCYMNFPRCNDAGESLLLCRSVCENFFRACGYPKVMWRCYNPEYYGGKAPEGTTGDQLFDSSGKAIFLRALLPGLPFQENEFVDKTDPLPLCTPAIAGAAPLPPALSLGVMALAAAAAAAALAGARR